MGELEDAAAQAVPSAGTTAEPYAISAEQAWYVAFVMTGREETVRRQMTLLFPELNVLVPRRALRERRRGQWRTVEKPVFPGYVFFQVALDSTLNFHIRRVYRVIRVLEQNRQPQPVYQEEMNMILHLVENQGLIGFSRVKDVEGKVMVTSGPLVGCEGLIVGADRRKGRVRIRLSVNGASRIVDVGAEWIGEDE
ncbi:MAG: antiterminator LoaP [Clostridiaceae bacterium]|nr:antiterminator LoaP [Clostridiaceae bacterium]